MDLTKWLEKGKKKGELFIVEGDFNEALKIGLKSLKLCTNNKVLLVDSLASKERENKSLSLSGHTVIDYVLFLQNYFRPFGNKATIVWTNY
eukprot:15340748-Ditylum_brightwellii.AAC.1